MKPVPLLALSLTLATLVMPSSFGSDNEVTGDILMQNCGIAIRIMNADHVRATNEDFLDSRYCMGLVEGVADTMNVYGTASYPHGVTTRQLIRVVYKYLNDHPEELFQRGTNLILKALREAYPPQESK